MLCLYPKETTTFVNILNHVFGNCSGPYMTFSRRHTLFLLPVVSNPKDISKYSFSSKLHEETHSLHLNVISPNQNKLLKKKLLEYRRKCLLLANFIHLSVSFCNQFSFIFGYCLICLIFHTKIHLHPTIL